MVTENFKIYGLDEGQVAEAKKVFGENKLTIRKENRLLNTLRSLLSEPMLILLLAAAIIYFLTNNTGDGIFMVLAIALISTISLYQEARSNKALKKIQELNQPTCKVFRNGKIAIIETSELVIGDSFIAEEGGVIPADGTIIQANDFSVNESILTGESLTVHKNENSEDKIIFQGTTVSSGLAIAMVTAIGNDTKLGKIGASLAGIRKEKTPLERQINNFVRKMVAVGTIIFLVVWLINYLNSTDLADSLLKALTLAMSILPEEIPVAFTTFMALGSWRLMRMGIVVKQIKTVETLGSATVICTDKTGTLTENRMSLASLFVLRSNSYFQPGDVPDEAARDLIAYSMWASEPIPFDPMEIAIHQLYSGVITPDERPSYKLIHEYPLSGTPPMMTHIFQNNAGARIVAAKGAPEALLATSQVNASEKKLLENAVHSFSSSGYRVLAVGASSIDGKDFPSSQQELKFQLKGIIAFYDPPKKNITDVLKAFYKAGISVKIITGDNAATTAAIAKQIGFRGYEHHITGEELVTMTAYELQEKVSTIHLFSRVFPEAKLSVIRALKANHEVVAMTGDGVNDGPALKAAHIGIAMGKKGTEIARQAASLILLEDDLSKMVDAIAIGRKIYSNLKKAIQYIISIHIPIILSVFIPLVLGWTYPNIFSPVHVIFFELIMGPTCSIIYENEPLEERLMSLPPRPFTKTFFNRRELFTSIIQGLLIATTVLFIYRYGLWQGYSEDTIRTMMFTTLIAANIFLTLVNRSFYHSALTMLKYKNNLIPWIIGITIVVSGLALYVPFLQSLFNFEELRLAQLFFCILTGFFSVSWFEGAKWVRRWKQVIPSPRKRH